MLSIWKTLSLLLVCQYQELTEDELNKISGGFESYSILHLKQNTNEGACYIIRGYLPSHQCSRTSETQHLQLILVGFHSVQANLLQWQSCREVMNTELCNIEGQKLKEEHTFLPSSPITVEPTFRTSFCNTLSSMFTLGRLAIILSIYT